MNEIGLRILGAFFLAYFVAMVIKIVIKPAPKLASRVRPYTGSSRSQLGKISDQTIFLDKDDSVGIGGVFGRLYRPLVEALLGTLMRLLGGAFDDETLALRIKQAGILREFPEERRVHEYRVKQISKGLGFGVAAVVFCLMANVRPGFILFITLLCVVAGVSRVVASVSSNIEDRRSRMRVELYTVNQLLAIYLRTSGSPVLAAQRLMRRGKGAVIDELNEALRLHTRGMSASKAFLRIAETTPEPFAARTYKLLASGSERGADLADALLSLSNDIRTYRRIEVQRTATKKQATMLIPIIALLAPVMLLFIAAPLPSMIKLT